MDRKKTKWLFWGMTAFTFIVVGLVFLGIFMQPMSAFESAGMPFSLPRIIITIPLGMAIIIFCLAYFVYKDAPKYGLDPWLWMTIAVYVPNLIGLILYFIMRSNPKRSCKSCGKSFDKALNICPYCGENHQRKCQNCFEDVNADWQVCPHCGQKLSQDENTFQKPKTNYLPLLVAGLLVIMSFIGMIALFFHLGGFDNFTSDFAIGRLASDGVASMKSSHMFYTGEKTRKLLLNEGDTIRIDFDCKTEEGDLTLALYDEENQLIDEIKNPSMGSLEYVAVAKEYVKVNVKADSHKGSYDIHWIIKK